MRHSLPGRTRGPKQREVEGQRVCQYRSPAKGRDGLILDYLESLGTPRALTAWMLYRYGEHRQLVGLAIDPLLYENAERFRRDYAATKFLSKCSGLKTGIDLKEVAIASAMQAEQLCSETNSRLRGFRDGSVRNPHASVWYRASAIISKILGTVPSKFRDVGWSHGRTSSAYGELKSVVHKYHSRPDVTRSARRHCLALLRESPLWGAALLNADGPASVLSSALVHAEGNHLITVPKNAKTDRTICYEPHMNIRLQLSVGSFIRYRLKKFGVDLNDQTINQRRARFGSITSKLATIDLSMASDTLALELVWELLPVDWACLLDDLRSKYTLWPDKLWRKCEKFSSMGNGFTFELESLVFYALASAVTEGVSVYGDDIIVPTSAFQDVLDVLEGAGFKSNTAKSFASGWFRESCGADMFRGLDCTPVYLRSLPKTRGDVAVLHNNVRRWASVNPKLSTAAMLRSWRCANPLPLGPQGYGDGHYHVNFEEALPSRCERGRDGWIFTTYSFVLGDPYYRRRKNEMEVEVSISGRFSQRFGWSALCASIGPKRTYDSYATTARNNQYSYVKTKGLANFCWPNVLWV